MSLILDTLGAFGSIASILSFNPILLNRFKTKNSLENSTDILEFMAGVTQTSKDWKTIHKAYHNLQRSIYLLINQTSYTIEGRKCALPVNRIIAENLKDVVVNSALWDFASYWQGEFGAFIGSLDEALAENMPHLDSFSNEHKNYKLALKSYQTRIQSFLKFHVQFTDFTGTLKTYENQTWGNEHIQYVISKYDVYSSNYFPALTILDMVLLSILDILELTIDERKSLK